MIGSRAAIETVTNSDSDKNSARYSGLDFGSDSVASFFATGGCSGVATSVSAPGGELWSRLCIGSGMQAVP